MVKVSPMPEIGRLESVPRSMLDPSKSMWRCGFDRIPKMRAAGASILHDTSTEWLSSVKVLPPCRLCQHLLHRELLSSSSRSEWFPFDRTVGTLVHTLEAGWRDLPGNRGCLLVTARWETPTMPMNAPLIKTERDGLLAFLQHQW